MRQSARSFGPLRVLPLVAAVAGLAACSDIRTEPDVQQEGMLESPTHEQDALRETEREEEREGDRTQ